MFQIKDKELVGTSTDIFEFAKRYNLLYKEEREMIDFGDFHGSIDDYALALGYSAPASTIFRNRVRELERLGILEITDCDVADRRHSIKKFHFKSHSEIINLIINLPLSDFSYRKDKHFVKKNCDKREEYSLKKRKGVERKIKNETKVEILELYSNGVSQSNIARKFNVSRQYINQIIKE